MDPEQKQFMSLQVPPARLNPEQTAWYLGFQPHDIPALIAAGLLKPLGHPPANGIKYFAAADLDHLRTDTKWLARATDAVHNHWRQRNGHKSAGDGLNRPATTPCDGRRGRRVRPAQTFATDRLQ